MLLPTGSVFFSTNKKQKQNPMSNQAFALIKRTQWNLFFFPTSVSNEASVRRNTRRSPQTVRETQGSAQSKTKMAMGKWALAMLRNQRFFPIKVRRRGKYKKKTVYNPSPNRHGRAIAPRWQTKIRPISSRADYRDSRVVGSGKINTLNAAGMIGL